MNYPNDVAKGAVDVRSPQPNLSPETLRRVPAASPLSSWLRRDPQVLDVRSESTHISSPFPKMSSADCFSSARLKERHRGKRSSLRGGVADYDSFSVSSGAEGGGLASSCQASECYGQSRPPTPTPTFKARRGEATGYFAALLVLALVIAFLVLSYPGNTAADLKQIQAMFPQPLEKPQNNFTRSWAAPRRGGKPAGSTDRKTGNLEATTTVAQENNETDLRSSSSPNLTSLHS